jgi:hypothetical protein
LPSGREYFGSTWAKDKTYIDRFHEHMQHKGGKYISQLINEGSMVSDFVTELIMIGELSYICDLEHQLAKTNLWPIGLNGNAGKNIVRTSTGQAIVSAAVSKAKTGKTKATSLGVASQAEKAKLQIGDARSEKQKTWDQQLSTHNKLIGKQPPVLPIGAKRMNNGIVDTFAHPNKIEKYLAAGWKIGSCKPRRALTEKEKHNLQKPKAKVSCLKCRKVFGTNGFARWNHYENCKGLL